MTHTGFWFWSDVLWSRQETATSIFFACISWTHRTVFRQYSRGIQWQVVRLTSNLSVLFVWLMSIRRRLQKYSHGKGGRRRVCRHSFRMWHMYRAS
jgi:hypothetical protein